MTPASLPSRSLGAPPRRGMLLSLSRCGEVRLTQLKPLRTPMQWGTGHCKAQRSMARQGSARSLFGCPGPYLQALQVRQRSAHAARLKQRRAQQKHPRNDANIKKNWFPVTAAESSLAARPQTSWRRFPPSSYLTQEQSQAPSSAALQRI